MSKLLAVMIAGLFAAGAYAQGTSPATTSNPPTDTKPQVAAEKKVEARPAGQVKGTPMPNSQEEMPQTDSKSQKAAEKRVQARPASQVKESPMPKSAEGDAAGAARTDKANIAGEKRAQTRDARRPAKDGGHKRHSTQGGTPQ